MLELLNYRRQVSDLYRKLRTASDPAAACNDFRQARDELFRSHSQSALDAEQKAAFTGLRYADYDAAYRVTARVEPVGPHVYEYDLDDDGHFRCRRFGQVYFTLPSGSGRLSLYWIEGYGGGVFLPFGDATSNQTTYGGGRYLLDTIKGADLGSIQDEIVLDFNFAYNPSCAYNPRWICPLSPVENRLAFPVMAGEKKFAD
jgi:uncharacterized protein